MGEAISEALAAGQKWEPSFRPGDEFAAEFREGGGYRKAMLAGAVGTCLSVALIVGDLTRLPAPEVAREVRTATAPRPIADVQDGLPVNRIDSAGELMAQLKAYQLWEIPADHLVPPVLFANYPPDFDLLDVATKKKVFLHTLLPAILLARGEIAIERGALENILATFDDPEGLIFDDEETAWQEGLSEPEIQFIDHLAGKYRSRQAKDLLARVDTFPVSLIMAQAAMESSWGSSRFAEKGNNIFGLWTWGEKGLVPTARDEGKDHKIAVYDTILGSVRAYLLTLNRLPAYRGLRQLRKQTRDPQLLTDGLHRYSERGMDYVAELKEIIRYNQLERYDRYRLAGDLPAAAPRAIKLSRL